MFLDDTACNLASMNLLAFRKAAGGASDAAAHVQQHPTLPLPGRQTIVDGQHRQSEMASLLDRHP
jgi:hypothetical protein